MSGKPETSRLSLQLPAVDRDIAARDEEIARLQRDLASRVAEIGRLCAELAARDGTLARTRDEFAARDVTISRLREDVARLERQCALLDERATTRATELENRDGELPASASDAARRDDDVARLSAEIARLEAAIRELHASTSWRVTAPIRAVKNAGLRLRAYLRRAIGALTRSRRSSLQQEDDIALIASSGLFDPEYYAAQAADVRERRLDPIVHYVTLGAVQGLDPHPLFDTAFYREHAPDVVESGANALVHYLRSGAARGVDPHPLFDTAYYRQASPQALEPGLNPLVHYLSHGAAEGRAPHPLFDPAFYLAQNPDVASSGENPLLHYLRVGARAGRDPHPLFETAFYLEQKPQVATLGVNPLVHFVMTGPTREFDPLSAPRPLPDTGICFVTPDIVGPVKNGGIGSACYHFARLLVEAGQAVTILFTIDLSPCRQAHWRNTYARMGIKFLSLSDMPPVAHHVHGWPWFLERSWRVFKYLERKTYALVHFQDWHANGFWSIKAKQVGIAFDRTTLTVMTHSCTKWIDEGMRRFGPEPIETAKLVWVETYAIEHCDVLLSPSRYMLDWLAQNGIRTPETVYVAPNAYTEQTEKKDGPPRGIDNDHLVFLGLLATRKGLHVFGDALRKLRSEGGSLPRTLSFLGTLDEVNGRPAAEYLGQLREDLAPIEFRVINHLDHVRAREYIERTRGLVVLPSLLDNCPYVVIECIENRFPFLVARTGGIPDMVDARATFEPTAAALATRLAERHGIDHTNMRHPYSVREAAKIWSDLHREQGPLEAPDHRSKQPASDLGESPRVSVCIPFFEHHRYLEALVSAFRSQTYADLEVILTNDGSGPEASREFDWLATRTTDPRLRFLTMEHRGPGAARNAAAEAATGNLLLFFDADSLPKSHDFVATLVRALRRSGADCLTCSSDIVDADQLLPTEQNVRSTYRPLGACLEVGFFQDVLGDATMILPRSVFTQVGGFPTGRASWEAHEFLLRLCFQGFRLEVFPKTLFYRRESPSDRDEQGNYFLNFQSLFEQLRGAPSGDLARIIATVGGPTLVARLGVRFARPVGR